MNNIILTVLVLVGSGMETNKHQKAIKSLETVIYCDGTYAKHLQGIDLNDRSIFWSWTTKLVKTDWNGKIQISVDADDHHGDLCIVNDELFVAVNLGKFNRPTGQADSWIYVYDANTLELKQKQPVPELVHGAGGIAYKSGRFYVVGGVPKNYNENYIYEYDKNFRFIDRHVLNSGYTLLGIQTITWAKDKWWFGCYGDPEVLLTADKNFTLISNTAFNGSLGIAFLGKQAFVGSNNKIEGRYKGKISSVYLE